MNWEPIETAPKDGSEILTNDIHGKCTLSSWISCGEWSGWAYCDDLLNDAHPLGPVPTHWLPIPELEILINEKLPTNP